VFVANIPPATTQSDIITHFKRVGDVVSLQLPQDENGQLLGHAFIEFVHPSQAEKAVQMLNHTTLQGRILSVRQHANDTDVIHVSQLPENVPATELYKLFGQVGELAYVHLPSAGRATVKYVKPHDAVKAVQVVSGTTVFAKTIKVVLARERKTMKAAGTLATSTSGGEPTLNEETQHE
jgi:RNA recognition motif-containing protein